MPFLFPFPETIFNPRSPAEYNTSQLQIADVLGLRTTSWEQGDPARTIFAIEANLFSLSDVDISVLAQGGFLDYAASGTVTYTDPVSGNDVTVYVTPDPADATQNPTGALGLLDVLAYNVYDVLRTLASPAGGTLAIANTSASTYGAFDVDGYHVAQPSAVGSPTYHNTASLTITPSATAGAGISAATNASPIAITDNLHGLATGDLVYIEGVLGNTAANGWWVITKTGANGFTLDGSTGNGAYTGGGDVYVPQTAAFSADEDGTTSDASAAGVITQPVTSLVGVNVYNTGPWLGSDTETNVELAAKCRLKLQSLSPNGPRGAYEYFALESIAYAPLLTPPLSVSNRITRALAQADLLTGTVTTTIANAAGAPSGSDVTATDAVIQAYCVPLAVTAITQAAANNSMAVVINAWVPAAYATAAAAAAVTAVQDYFRALPIGGVTDPAETAPNTNIVPYNAVLGAVFKAFAAAKIPCQQVTGTVDGGTANVQLALSPVPEVATLSATPTVNIISV
jgi:hypothetical protein